MTDALKELREKVADRVADLNKRTSTSHAYSGEIAVAKYLLWLELLERDRDMLTLLDALIEEEKREKADHLKCSGFVLAFGSTLGIAGMSSL